MKLPLQIIFRDVVPLPSIEPEIRRRADKLDHWVPDVMSCHVAVEAEGNRHHTGHAYRVTLRVRVPGEEIAVSTHHVDENIHRAIHGAFDAVDRRLEDHARRQRHQTKAHHDLLIGRITALSDDGVGVIVGVIVGESGETYHFDRSHVENPGFDQLAVGQTVSFLEGVTRAGREARRIAPSKSKAR